MFNLLVLLIFLTYMDYYISLGHHEKQPFHPSDLLLQIFPHLLSKYEKEMKTYEYVQQTS